MPEINLNTLWEIVDNGSADVACAPCVVEWLDGKGIYNHKVGTEYRNETLGVYATEDVFGEHRDCGQPHFCSGCGKVIGE